MSAKPGLTARPPAKFDLQKLESMTEPFSVRVEKVRGSVRQLIPLPTSSDGSPPGTGWSKDQVREIESWLVNEWVGGGHYAISIVDSAAQPQLMDWTVYYPPSEFPEKIPPTLQGAASMFPVAQPIQLTPPQVRPMAQFPGMTALPSSASYFQQPNVQPQPVYAQQPAFYGYQNPAPQPGAETNALREQLAAMREQVAQREFERRLAEIKAESDRRFVETQQMMQQMIERMTQQITARAPVADPAVNELREQNRLMQDRLRQAEETAARERREQELQAQIRTSQDETRRLIEESNRRYETFMREASADKSNPQIMMFQTMFQSQMEAMKEIARNSSGQIDRLQHYMLRPQDVLQMAKESSSGADDTAMRMNRAWQDIFQVNRQLIEQAAQLNQGGGNEVVGLIRDAGTRLGEWAEKYTGGKTKEAVASVNAQAEIARAQADVIKSQQERMSEMARIEASLKTGAAVQMPDGTYRAGGASQPAIPPPAAPTNGANGHGVTPSTAPWVPPRVSRTNRPEAAAPVVVHSPTPVVVQSPIPVGSGLGGAPVEQATVIPLRQSMTMTGEMKTRRIHGRTDEEWFGPILQNVNLLRSEVDKFIVGLQQSPRVAIGATPDRAAMVIQQAAYEILNRGIPIPAMVELLMQGMVADFLDVLLPDAPQPYRDDVAKILLTPEDTGDNNDENEDEGDDEDEEQPASVS